MPAMSSALNVRPAVVPGANAIGNITASAAVAQFGLAERGVAEPAQVPDLMERDALQIETIGLARWTDRPLKRRVEEDVGFDERPGSHVDDEARGREHPIEIRSIAKAERR